MYTPTSVTAAADGRERTPPAAVDGQLLHDARCGNRAALQTLCSRCLPMLRRWAHRYLPRGRCGINDADDLVQIALLRAMNHLGEFEVRSDASFLGYLRQILLNEVRGELRKQRRRGETVEYDDALAADGDPVFEQLLAQEREHAYARAVRKLNEHQREHLCLRVEFGMSFGEIARKVGSSSDGARMTVVRAVRAMSEHLAAVAA